MIVVAAAAAWCAAATLLALLVGRGIAHGGRTPPDPRPRPPRPP